MNSNNHNSKLDAPCAFAETLVAVLYGEAEGADAANFHSHLPHCSACRDEFASFGVIKNSVANWRDTEFAPLTTPAIILPQPEKSVTVMSEKASWLENLRGFFAPSNVWAQGATAFAAIAVCAMLIYVFAFSSGKQENYQATETPQIETPATNNQTAPALPIDEVAQNDKPKPIAAPTPPNRKSEIKPATVSDEKSTAPKTKTNARPAAKRPAKLPAKDLDDVDLQTEDEDRTLRLTDLFDELESGDDVK